MEPYDNFLKTSTLQRSPEFSRYSVKKRKKETIQMMECKEATSLESYFLFLANFSHDRAKEVMLRDTDVPICVELLHLCVNVV